MSDPNDLSNKDICNAFGVGLLLVVMLLTTAFAAAQTTRATVTVHPNGGVQIGTPLLAWWQRPVLGGEVDVTALVMARAGSPQIGLLLWGYGPCWYPFVAPDAGIVICHVWPVHHDIVSGGIDTVRHRVPEDANLLGQEVVVQLCLPFWDVPFSEYLVLTIGDH